jgi:hypothetical protein
MFATRKAAWLLLIGAVALACSSDDSDDNGSGGSGGTGGKSGGYANACSDTKCSDDFPILDSYCDWMWNGPCAEVTKTYFECNRAHDVCSADGSRDRNVALACFDLQKMWAACVSDGGTK